MVPVVAMGDNGRHACACIDSPGYTWSQTQSTVTLAFEVPATVTVMDIMVNFQSDQLVAGVEVCCSPVFIVRCCC